MNNLQELLTSAAESLFNLTLEVGLTRPDAQFGDYSTNLAMQLAPQLKRPPREVAEELQKHLKEQKHALLADVSVAGPGFLNLTLTDAALWQAMQVEPLPLNKGRKILLEYSCPNAFKELHTGHLYQTIVGDTLGRLLKASGAELFRANFGGDVGLHVAKALYGIQQALGGDEPDKLGAIAEAERPAWLSEAYVVGAKAYEADAKDEIEKLNHQIYGFHERDDHESPLARIYWECREWSYDYFKAFYDELDVAPFDKYYPESQTTVAGVELVEKHRGDVFVEDNGAVIFRGEEHGEHTRVFLTSKGLPTYETKDLGVIVSEATDFEYDQRYVLTGNDQTEYMRVVFAALLQIDEELALKQKHLVNGTIRFGSGQKMSSRQGNVTPAIEVLTSVYKTVRADNEPLRRDITLGAIKYSFLKQRLGGDINFDVEESVSLQGNSGPYLQYAHARARSILKKAAKQGSAKHDVELQPDERRLLRALTMYQETVTQAITELLPHHICNYLYELAQEFNRFYEKNTVVGDPREGLRLVLVENYAEVLRHGLGLLNIPAPEHI